jgi:endothelin-converting enzyme/putative endopeptidase
MKYILRPTALAGLLAAACFAQNHGPAPAIRGLDLGAIDSATNPCDDFYKFSCGTWLKNNPIPADQAAWGRFSELNERNREILHQILERAAANPGSDPDHQKIGDYYASCMDEKTINNKGLAPIQAELDRIHAMQSPQDLGSVVGRLHRLGVNVLFNFSSGPDFKDSTVEIGQADQGGLGLPERDYYFRTDAKAEETRKRYVDHLAQVFNMMGSSTEAAQRSADAVMKLETALAKVSLDVTSRRDPIAVYHKMKLAEFEALADSFNWSRYFAIMQAPPMESLNVAVPDFFKGAEALLKSQPLDVWKDYFSVHLVDGQAQFLPKQFDEANFGFFGNFLTGAKEQKTRWKRCVASTDGDLGFALGRFFVEQTFGAEGKQRTLAMVHQIEAAMERDLNQITWMTPETKKRAVEKLHQITNKIGYPDKWRDYSALRIVRGDALGNSLRANEFEVNRQIQKIGKPVDRSEWEMTPPTVNAYYDPTMNNINFPAGILQPPFFSRDAGDEVNYGAIGAVIGHELTHGFDDEGSQFDGKGNLDDWWTKEDRQAFDQREKCLIDEYSAFEGPGGIHEQGKLTLGENTADQGGLRLASMALIAALAGRTLPKQDGFTTEQRFFLAFGQIWCTNETEEVERLRLQTDPHSLPQFRVNGVVSNMPEFQKAFGCKPNAPMVRGEARACRTW